jgi:hypothetical protein
MRRLKGTLWTTVALASTGACDFTHDSVAPGYYDDIAATAGRAAVSAAGSGNKSGAPTAVEMRAMSSVTMPAAAMPTTASPVTSPPATTAQPASSKPAASCDLSGRWLQTVHKTTDGLGNLQYAHNYFYYEIAQQAETFTVSKSLLCGTSVIGGGAFAVTVEFNGALASLRQHVSHNGRTGRSVSAANGCMVTFDKQYMVFGATLPHYLDPVNPLPSSEEPATNGKPGWEDWDGDGNPGITGICSGTVTGKIFVAPREWSTLTGSVPNVSSLFKLSMNWEQEPNVMAFDGSPFLGSSAVRAADASLHFVQFARLSDDQASGDDAALCKRIVELAPMLTPEAAGM